MGFFKSGRKADNSVRARERVAETLRRSAYPVRRSDSPCDSRPLPVAFAKSDSEESDVDGEPVVILRPRSARARAQRTSRRGDTVTFSAFGITVHEVRPDSKQEKHPTVAVEEVSILEPDSAADGVSCTSGNDSDILSDQVDALRVTPIRDSIQGRSPYQQGLYSLQEHTETKLDVSAQTVKSSAVITGTQAPTAAALDAERCSIRTVEDRSQGDSLPARQQPSQTTTTRRSSLAAASTHSQSVSLPVRRPSIQRTRSFLRPITNESNSSLSSANIPSRPVNKLNVKPAHVVPKPRLLAVLEVRLQTLQDQYDQLNVQYHQLTSHQVETLEIVKDIKSDLCTTQITTAENTIEIAGLHDTQRQLAVELATLKATVSECKQELRGLSHRKSDSSLSTVREDKAKAHRRWRVKEGTVIDLSQKEKPKRMSLEQYKLHCARAQLSSESLARTTSLPSLAETTDEVSETQVVVAVQAKSEQASIQEKPEQVAAQGQPEQSAAQTRQSTVLEEQSKSVPAPVARKAVPVYVVNDQYADKSKNRQSSGDKFKATARDKFASVSYFHKFRTKAGPK